MTQWEYCEVWYTQAVLSGGVTVNVFSTLGLSQQKYSMRDWPKVFSQLGADGWELVGMMPSPTGVQQYWYYFKRPICKGQTA